ncbi:MAG: trypsin-like peptidase domain-containing protein [Chloroflexota bacterium]
MVKRILTVVLGAALVFGGYLVGTTQSTDAVAAQDGLRTEYERLFSGVFESVSPSVVSINVLSRGDTDNPFQDEEDFFSGGGTGFVYDKVGHLVTNAHVVDGAEEIAVYFRDGTIAAAEVVALDFDSDIAVILVSDVPEERLLPVTFGDSGALTVGQATLAIGSPFGEEWTLTSGIVSALNRSIRSLGDFSTGAVIQTDTAINPGNSGGPLLNLDGEVIGVNTQILSATRSSSGVGFAVPSNLVQRVAAALIENGEVDYSYMGISGQDNFLGLIEDYNLPNNLQGAVVSSVQPGSPASDAGLRNPTNTTLDVITAIDGADIGSMDDLLAYLSSNTQPGDTVTMTVFRDGDTVALPITLGARPEQVE